jgi:hypothetical protein
MEWLLIFQYTVLGQIDATVLIYIYSMSCKLATTGNNAENGQCSLNVISVFTTMIGSHADEVSSQH